MLEKFRKLSWGFESTLNKFDFMNSTCGFFWSAGSTKTGFLLSAASYGGTKELKIMFILPKFETKSF